MSVEATPASTSAGATKISQFPTHTGDKNAGPGLEKHAAAAANMSDDPSASAGEMARDAGERINV